MKAACLTTVDNPYDPFEQFRDWLNFDESHDYGCCSIVARLAPTSEDMLPSEVNRIVEKAIDNFVFADPTGIYMKVTKEIETNYD